MKRQFWLTTALVASIWISNTTLVQASTFSVSLVPTQPENQVACGWCGNICTRAAAGTMCPQVMPEPGAMCITNSTGACTVLMSSVTPGPTSVQREVTPTPDAVVTAMPPVDTRCTPVNREVVVLPDGDTQAGCHDLKEAIANTTLGDTIYLKSGRYTITPELVNGVNVGLYLNKIVHIIGNETTKPVLSISNAYAGIWIDKVSATIDNVRFEFKDIQQAGVMVDGIVEPRSFMMGNDEFIGMGNVPVLVKVKGFLGADSLSRPTGIIDSYLSGAEKAAVELVEVSNFDILRNTITTSTMGVLGQAYNKAEKLKVNGNKISEVRSGIVLGGRAENGIWASEFSNNTIYNFGSRNYKDWATKYQLTSTSGMNLTYFGETIISGNLITNGFGSGLMLSNGAIFTGVKVEKNVFDRNDQSVAMSGGYAVFTNNTFLGNPTGKGGGLIVTSLSQFVNNVFAHTGDLQTVDDSGNQIVSVQCALDNYNEGQSFFDSKLSNNLFFNNTKNYCSSKCANGLCTFTEGSKGNISGDPKLGNDYCLSIQSAAIGKGVDGVNIGAKDVCACSTKVAGDTGCDGKAGLDDFAVWKNEYLKKVVSTRADFSGDGSVGLEDFAIWKKSFLMTN